MPTGFIYHPDYLKHETGGYHPERPQRLLAIVRSLQASGQWEELIHLTPREATQAEIERVHHPGYVDEVEWLTSRGGGYLDLDTPLGAESFAVARLAAGGAVVAVDAVLRGEVQNAFVAVRPPGHHARPGRGMGFCLFNNIAIAARQALEQGVERIFIVDWDVHHGNGTQEAFYRDGRVFFFSVHQQYWFPGTGRPEERGAGEGEGTTLNTPLPAGCGDAEYQMLFERVVEPRARAFQPELFLISAGQDSHAGDPLGRMQLTSAGFGQLARLVCRWAEDLCAGRVVAVLEGGYNLEALGESVGEIVHALQSAAS